MPLDANHALRCSARFKSTVSGDIVNVYHWYPLAAVTVTDDDIFTAVFAKLSAMFANIASNITANVDPYDLRLDEVEFFVDHERVVRTLGTRTWTLTNPPVGAGDGLPSMDAAIVNFRSVLPGTYGRKYLGSIIEGNQAEGTLTGACVTAITSWATSYLAYLTLGAVNCVPCVISAKTNDVGSHFIALVSAVINSLLGTQRRRRVNRGS